MMPMIMGETTQPQTVSLIIREDSLVWAVARSSYRRPRGTRGVVVVVRTAVSILVAP